MDAEDVLIWPHSQDGQYSCKSGYRFLKDEEAMDNAQDDAIMDSKLWKGIWTLQVPNKVKNLLWRACRNAFPTKEILIRWTIIIDPLCDRCMKHMRHLYMLCGIARN
uniref:Reverse transcriptase zinc-binding domain-containing protein n=1 Tax=Quercus lobata TaxID=97700 RepID=A0A7N2N1Z6_QUELO